MLQHTIEEATAGILDARSESMTSLALVQIQPNTTELLTPHLSSFFRLHSPGLTVNEKKCESNKDETEFFGFET